MSRLTKTDFARRLKEARAERGLTQREVAERSGVPLPTCKDYEGGKTLPGSEHLARLAELGISPLWLLLGTGPMLLRRPEANDDSTASPRAPDASRLLTEDDLIALADYGAAMLRQEATTRAVAKKRVALPFMLVAKIQEGR